MMAREMLLFGQPDGAICQIGFFVPDVHAAIDSYVMGLGIGPWVLIEHFKPEMQWYHGEVSTTDLSIATAYSGSMMIELIEQHDDSASVFRDSHRQGGYGLQHYGIMVDDYDGELARLLALGHDLAFNAVLPELMGGGRASYVDTRSCIGLMTELLDRTAPLERMFAAMKDLADHWDGHTRLADPDLLWAGTHH